MSPDIIKLSRKSRKNQIETWRAATFGIIKINGFLGHYDNGQYHLYVLPQQSSVIANNYGGREQQQATPTGGLQFPSSSQSMMMGQNQLQIEVVPPENQAVPSPEHAAAGNGTPVPGSSADLPTCWASMTSQASQLYQTTAAINSLEVENQSDAEKLAVENQSLENQNAIESQRVEFGAHEENELLVKAEKNL